jgi:ATP-dependent DNA helicase RecQ
VRRLRQVLDFADHEGCRTRFLLTYFGEDLEADCGHCGGCAGERPGKLPPSAVGPPGAREAAKLSELRAEKHEALASARQVARFLCGINSPSATRAKLTKHKLFGLLSDVPFKQVLTFVEGEAASR